MARDDRSTPARILHASLDRAVDGTLHDRLVPQGQCLHKGHLTEPQRKRKADGGNHPSRVHRVAAGNTHDIGESMRGDDGQWHRALRVVNRTDDMQAGVVVEEGQTQVRGYAQTE